MSSSDSSLKCPKCGQTRIAKVSGVYAEGKTIGSTSGSTPNYLDAQSVLSTKLSPPDMPKIEGCLFPITIVVLYVLFSLGGILLLIALLDFVFMNPFGTEHSSDSWLLLVCFAAPGFLFLIVAIILLVTVIVTHTRVSKEIATKMPFWRRAMDRWNKLYYCEVDDGVFDPEVGEFIPIDKMKEYLYR